MVFVKNNLASQALFALHWLAIELNLGVSEAANHFENVSEIAYFDSLAFLSLDQFPQLFDQLVVGVLRGHSLGKEAQRHKNGAYLLE